MKKTCWRDDKILGHGVPRNGVGTVDLKFLGLDRGCIDGIVNAHEVEDAWKLLIAKSREFGFDHVVYGTNRLRRVGNFGKLSDSFFLSTLPEHLMRKFREEELYRTVPVAIWAMRNKGVISLRHGADLFHSGQLPDDQAATQRYFLDAGITGGYVVSYTEPDTLVATALAFLQMGPTQDETDILWEEKGCELQTYAGVFNLRAMSLPVPLPGKGLTNRQKEVLHWIAQGKTTNEIATILGLSGATIEKHLRQARDSFGVNTTLQAVLYAQITSQFFTNGR